MATDTDNGRKYAPLSETVRPWEREKLRVLRLEDVPWDADCECPWCTERLLPGEEAASPGHVGAGEEFG